MALTLMNGIESSDPANMDFSDTGQLTPFQGFDSSNVDLSSSLSRPRESTRPTTQEFPSLSSYNQPKVSGTDLVLALIGGPQSMQLLAQQRNRAAAGPIIYDFKPKFDLALKNGDIEGANRLIQQLGALAGQNPALQDLYKSAAETFTKIQDRTLSNQAAIDVMKPFAETPAQKGFIDRLQQGVTKMDQSLLKDFLPKIFPRAEVRDSIVMQLDNLTGKLSGTQVLPPTTESSKNISKEERAAYQARGIDPDLATVIHTKVLQGQATQEETLVDKMWQQGLMKDTTTIRKGQILTPAAQFEGAPTPGDQDADTITGYPPSGDVTSKPLPLRTPKSNITSGKVPPFGPARDIFLENKAQEFVDNEEEPDFEHGMARALKELAESENKSAKPPDSHEPGLSLAERKTRIEEERKYRDAKALEQGKGEARYQSQQSVAVKFTKDGRIITKYNIPQAQIDTEGWALLNQPVEEMKIFSAYGSLKEQARSALKLLEDTPEYAMPSDNSDLMDRVIAGARRLAAQGVAPIAIAGHSVGTAGLGNIVLNRDEAKLYNKLAVLMRKAEQVYNITEKDDPRLGDLRSMVTGKFATKESIEDTIKDITEAADDHVRGMIRARNPNAVEESDRKPRMPNTNFLGIGNIPSSLPPVPTGIGLPGTAAPRTAAPNTAASPAQSNARIPLSQEDIAGAAQIDTGTPALPTLPPTRTPPQVGPTSPLGNSPTINPGRQVSGEIPVRSPRTLPGPVPVRAGENIEVLQVPIGSKTIETIKRSFKERSNVK